MKYPKTITADWSMEQALAPASGAQPYLGDWQTVNGLLRTYAHQVLTADHASAQDLRRAADRGARLLARAFLGQDKRYAVLPWNSPGQIDVYVARRCGIQSDDPEERVAGALVRMVADLYTLAQTIENQQLVNEQWTGEAGDTIRRCTNLLMGMPMSGYPAVYTTSLNQSSLRKS